VYRNDLDIEYQICNIRGLVCDSTPSSVATILKRIFCIAVQNMCTFVSV